MSNMISDVVKYLVLSARTSLPESSGCGQDRHPSAEALAAMAHRAGFPDSLAVPFGTPPNEEVTEPMVNGHPYRTQLFEVLAEGMVAMSKMPYLAPEFRLTSDLEPTLNPQLIEQFDISLFSRKGIPGSRGTDPDFVMSQCMRFAELSGSKDFGPLVLVDPFVDVQDLGLDWVAIAEQWAASGVIIGLSLDFWLKKELGQEDPNKKWSQSKQAWQNCLAEDIVPRQRAALAQAGVSVVLLTNFHGFGPYTDPEGDLNSLFWSQAGEFVAYHRAIDDLRVLKGMRGLLDEIGTTRDMRA